MLEIINRLEPYFQDNYVRISVREYARLKKISPPHASSLLNSLEKQELLKKEKERGYHFFYPNRTNNLFIDLSRIYWQQKIKKLGIIEFIKKRTLSPVIILFGSLAKAEFTSNSDIDIAIFTVSEKKIDLSIFEKKLKHEIQLFTFKTRKDVKNKELLNNILNGYKLAGNW